MPEAARRTRARARSRCSPNPLSGIICALPRAAKAEPPLSLKPQARPLFRGKSGRPLSPGEVNATGYGVFGLVRERGGRTERRERPSASSPITAVPATSAREYRQAGVQKTRSPAQRLSPWLFDASFSAAIGSSLCARGTSTILRGAVRRRRFQWVQSPPAISLHPKATGGRHGGDECLKPPDAVTTLGTRDVRPQRD